MSVKKIIASSMPEAIHKVKKEMGEDAVVLSSRVVWTGGVLGLFKKKQFEVVAVVDGEERRLEEGLPQVPLEHNEPLGNGYEREILSELSELKQLIASGHKEASLNMDSYPDVIKKITQKLLNHEVTETYAREISKSLMSKWHQASKEPTEINMMHEAKQALHSMIEDLDFSVGSHKKFIALVGPTGVGKTTTLAKLAAHAVLEEQKKIAFITLDTYRIAAIEQLKTYAKLLDVPVEVVYDSNDFLKAAKEFAEYDHIFIDTAGRNYRDEQFVHALNDIFLQESELDVFLVLTMTMRERDIEGIMGNFRQIPVSKLIFTKADETEAHGLMINMMLKYQLPTAYITTGQDVPDDIIRAEPHILSEYIFGDDGK